MGLLDWLRPWREAIQRPQEVGIEIPKGAIMFGPDWIMITEDGLLQPVAMWTRDEWENDAEAARSALVAINRALTGGIDELKKYIVRIED